MKIPSFPLFIAITLLASACSGNKLKEYREYKTTYSYKDGIADSVTVLEEHSFFNKDSIVIKHFNEKVGYYYLAYYIKKKGLLRRDFYEMDSTFKYSSISRLDNLGREVESRFLDSSSNVTYTLKMDFLGTGNKIKRQRSIFMDSSMYKLIYNYDDDDNLVEKSSISNSDTSVLEYHDIDYSEDGRILIDTAYYPEGRKIIHNEYRDGLLFYRTEKFEVNDGSASRYRPLGNSYWKRYYICDGEGRELEIRTIRMQSNEKSFGLDSRIVRKYEDDLMIRETLINSSDQIVYSRTFEYVY